LFRDHGEKPAQSEQSGDNAQQREWYEGQAHAEEEYESQYEQESDETNRQKEQDPYVVLGLSEDASEEDVEDAWRALILRYHTDKYQKDRLYEERTAKAAEINHARDEIRKRKGWKKCE